MINVLIVDDEKPAGDELEFLLRRIPDISICGVAESGYEALSLSRKCRPDLVFLDIKMPEMGGFEVADNLRFDENSPGIIFTTAYDKFAIKAFEINALDYILKPYSRERLQKSIHRYISQSENEKSADYKSICSLIQDIPKRESCPRYITISLGEHFKPILIDDIIIVVAEGRDIRIMTVDGEFHHSKSITSMDTLLDNELFFRCHRGYIINLNFIKKIDIWFNNTYQLEMVGLIEKIPVSRSYIGRFRELMAIN